MFLREMTEELERQTLSPYAALSADSRGGSAPWNPVRSEPAINGILTGFSTPSPFGV